MRSPLENSTRAPTPGSANLSITPIDDPDDPRVAVFREVRERDVAGRAGGFIAEGEVVLNVLARTPLYTTRAVLIAEKRLDRLTPLLARFGAGTPIYAAGQAVMDKIAGFAIHRGILAFGARAAPTSAATLLDGLSEAATVIVLFGISNHDNIGGIFRNAAAFGVEAVLIDGGCCDPLYRKAIRVSVGGVLTVPFARLAPGEDAVAMLDARGFEVAALSPKGLQPLSGLVSKSPMAVLLGGEGDGLPVDVLARARTISIPMAGGFDSLNVATTSGIVLHHLRESSPHGSRSGANPEPAP